LFAGEVLAQQSVRILVAAALPRTLGVTEVHLHTGVDRERDVAGHLLSLVPRQRPPQLLGQGQNVLAQRREDGRRVDPLELDQ
jgi:hypothetical protein